MKPTEEQLKAVKELLTCCPTEDYCICDFDRAARDIWALVRNAALEEAARVVSQVADEFYVTSEDGAAAMSEARDCIRALKTP